MTNQDMYNELLFYTLSHQDKRFIHQHAVDAFTAQNADEHTKTITIFFALAGLYLFTVKDYTGKQVQDAHLAMAKKTKDYIRITLPEYRGNITVKDALDASPGFDRDDMISQWCISVWSAFSHQHSKIIAAVHSLL